MQYSIVNFNEVDLGNRIDAEYFQPTYLELEKKLKKIGKKLSIFLEQVNCGPFGSTLKCETYLKEGIIVARPFNINNYQLELDNNIVYIDKKDCKDKNLKFYHPEDVFFSRVGDIRIGIVPQLKNDLTLTISPNIIAAKINREKVSPYYVVLFFNSKYGYLQIERSLKIVAQPTISTDLINELFIVDATKKFQEIIENHFKKSIDIKYQSIRYYNETQTLLLSELGLLDWKPKHRLNFIKNYSDTQQAGRFDAEYFQPKYDEIMANIKNHAGGWDTLGNLVSLKKCIEVGSEQYSDEGIPFVRVSNLSPFEITEEKYISEKLYSELTPKEESDVTFETSKNHQPKKGEILFSKDATPGLAYFLSEEPQKMIPSGGILRLKPKDKRIKPSYLTLVLNSIIVQEQIDRDVGGSVILHWRPDQVEQTLIPILEEDKQDEIQQKISESFNLRKQSKHLLECTKKAVEMAIEKDEETAMQWLESQIDSIERGN